MKMLAQLIAVGVALLLAAAVSASDVQEMAPPSEAINGLKSFADESFEDVSEIFGGFQAPNERIPYFTYLVYYGGRHIAWTSGGSLIHDDIVLTAAHNLFVYQGGPPWTRIVAFGALKENFDPLDPFNPSTGQWRDVVVRYVAPNFNYRNKHNDIALLKLASPIGGVVKPKLNRSPAIPAVGKDVIVVGYGTTQDDDDTPASSLMGAIITNQAPNVCADRYPSYYEESMMICASKPYEGACSGDTGGPLILPSSLDSSGDIQVGIMSIKFGGCADNAAATHAYTRVSAYYELIVEFVCAQSSYRDTFSDCD